MKGTALALSEAKTAPALVSRSPERSEGIVLALSEAKKAKNIKDITFIIRATPFNTIALSEAMRMAVGLTLHDNRVNILLTGEGVWNALKLAPHIIGRPDIYESLEHFSACGVKVFVDEVSLMERGISGHEGHIEKISRKGVYDLVGSSDVVMSFR